MPEAQAKAFIRRQMGEYQLLRITSMTPKQRARIDSLDVVSSECKMSARTICDMTGPMFGPPPHTSTGRMRRINMLTGEAEHSAPVPRQRFNPMRAEHSSQALPGRP